MERGPRMFGTTTRGCGKIAIGALMLAFVGCATSSQSGTGPQIPDRSQLESRIKVFAEAVLVGNYKTQWEMRAPYKHRVMTYDDFRLDRGIDDSQAPRTAKRLLGAPRVKALACDYYEHSLVRSPLFRCLLSVETTVIGEDGREESESALQMWEYQEGRWYFGMEGHLPGG